MYPSPPSVIEIVGLKVFLVFFSFSLIKQLLFNKSALPKIILKSVTTVFLPCTMWSEVNVVQMNKIRSLLCTCKKMTNIKSESFHKIPINKYYTITKIIKNTLI